MNINKYLIILPVILIGMITNASATEYYASPSGAGSACSSANPCKISAFWSKALPGDILNLRDGIYTGSDSMINPPSNLNGSSCSSMYGGTSTSRQIVVRAVNDGKAIIDGQWSRIPARLTCIQYLVIEGVRFQNSSQAVIVFNRSDHNVLRRISAYNANYHFSPTPSCLAAGATYYNYHVLDLTYGSEYNLVEDSIFGGSGRNMIDSFESDFNILRRNVLMGGGYARDNTVPGCGGTGENHGEPLQIYGSSDNVIENVIAFNVAPWGSARKTPFQAGMNIWANNNQTAHRNRFYGSLVMGYEMYGFYHSSVCNRPRGIDDSDECLTGGYFENVVSFRNGLDLWANNGRNIIFKNASFLEAGKGPAPASSVPSSGIYIAQLQDADKSSSFRYENALVAGGSRYGCYGSSALDPSDVTFDHAVFYSNPAGDFGGKCGGANQINVTTGVNPNLTSLVYVDATSPAYTAGKGGEQVGADMRCRYISKFDGGGIVTEHVKQDMWPLPGFINDRAKAESQQIYGRVYDPNAIVLDALGPRDINKLICTAPLPPGEAGGGGEFLPPCI